MRKGFLLFQLMESIKDCFVTGKWQACEDAQALLEEDGGSLGYFCVHRLSVGKSVIKKQRLDIGLYGINPGYLVLSNVIYCVLLLNSL